MTITIAVDDFWTEIDGQRCNNTEAYDFGHCEGGCKDADQKCRATYEDVFIPVKCEGK